MVKENIVSFDEKRKLNSCPRCGSTKLKVTKHKNDSLTYSEVTCKDCNLKLAGHNAQYIQTRWNTPKEDIVEYTLDLLDKNPYTAYVNEYDAEVWGGAAKLCKYLSKKLGRKITSHRPNNFVGGGYILEGEPD